MKSWSKIVTLKTKIQQNTTQKVPKIWKLWKFYYGLSVFKDNFAILKHNAKETEKKWNCNLFSKVICHIKKWTMKECPISKKMPNPKIKICTLFYGFKLCNIIIFVDIIYVLCNNIIIISYIIIFER